MAADPASLQRLGNHVERGEGEPIDGRGRDSAPTQGGPSPGGTGGPQRFGAVHAVRGVDFGLAADRYVTLLGPSGCGKTTILRLIGGFETVTAGAIELDGRSPSTRPPVSGRSIPHFRAMGSFPT